MLRKICGLLLLVALISTCLPLSATAYNAKPKLVVVIVVDQLRGDLLERYHDQFVPDGFRYFLDNGAWFSNTYYQYANTKTAPGHATIGTGTYSLGHGIMANEFWDPKRRRVVTSTEDDTVDNIGADVQESCPAQRNQPVPVEPVAHCGSSPRNLLTVTLSDELKLATGGRAKVFGIAFKDRSAILPVGHSANAAFYTDHVTGQWQTSTYYMSEAPEWLVAYNKSSQKYESLEWKNTKGDVLGSTAPQERNGKPVAYYDRVGRTPFANAYTIDMARTVIENEKLGTNDVTDFLSVSFSAPDILGHQVGPDSPLQKEMLLALDRQLAEFIKYLNAKFGAENLVLAITADHGVAPIPPYPAKLRIEASNNDPKALIGEVNARLNTKINALIAARAPKHQPAATPQATKHPKGKAPAHTAPAAPAATEPVPQQPRTYIVQYDYPTMHMDSKPFEEAGINESEAEHMVGAILVELGMRSYATKIDLAAGKVNNSIFTRQLLNAYSPEAGWYVISSMPPFMVGYASGTGHALPYSYDAHVPLAFAGPQFRPGQYRTPAEPVDLAVTLASVLGINKPASSVGRVLTEAIVDQQTATSTNEKASGAKR